MTCCDDLLPPLKSVIKTYSLSANKTLGQNFLLDMNLLDKIAKATCVDENAHVLEVGAGPGGLTRALLKRQIQKLVVIEKDKRCLPILEEIKAVYPNQLAIYEGDALKINFDDLFDGMYHIVTNLPYQISSEFVTGLLTQETFPPRWLGATMMLQKEFAMRMQAKPDSPNSKDYGRLSVLCSLTCKVKILFDVKPANFTPPPKVMSSIVQITPLAHKPVCDLNILANITRATFGQRRKMLRTSLKQITSMPEALCASAGIDPTLRADQLAPDDYVRLVIQLENQIASKS